MEQDYFKTLPSGYIEYIDKLMNNLVVGNYMRAKWSTEWEIRLDDTNGNPVFSITVM